MLDKVLSQPSGGGSIVIGYHGCDEALGRRLVSGSESKLRPSKNRYDWLGAGTYFFEKDYSRARHFAESCVKYPEKHYSQSNIVNPFVVGAVIHLGNCLDLSTLEGITEAQLAGDALREFLRAAGRPLPKNREASGGDKDLIVRNLDRAIIQFLHTLRERDGLPPYDTVRCPFPQGKAIAHTSAFRKYSHVQIAVRNANCVLGYHLPRAVDASPFDGVFD